MIYTPVNRFWQCGYYRLYSRSTNYRYFIAPIEPTILVRQLLRFNMI